MNRQTINVVIDYNNLFFRSLFTTPAKKDANTKYFQRQQDINAFVCKLCKDTINILQNHFTQCRVYVAMDDKNPWRRDILDTMPVSGYKANRTRSEEYDWDTIYHNSNVFRDLFTTRTNACKLEVTRGEADDIMCLLKEELFKKTDDNSIVFVTSDQDIRQLIDYNASTGQYVCCMNPISKVIGNSYKRDLYVHPEQLKTLRKTLNEDGTETKRTAAEIIFGDFIMDKYDTDMLFNEDKVVFTEENPDDVLIHKLLCGDDGDNIPALYVYTDDKLRTKRITPSIEKKIRKSLFVNTAQDLNESLDALDDAVKRALKVDELDYEVSGIRYEKQRKLVELNKDLFPVDMVNEFSLKYYDLLGVEKLTTATLNIEHILSGTGYMDYINTPTQNATLRDVNRYLKKNAIDALFD